MKKLTNNDFCKAAKRLKCEVASIKAFGEVESKRAAFDKNGFPTILFERHKFYKYATNRKEWAKSDPDICNPVAGGYGSYASQKPKFDRAFKLDPHAAMMACSWGMFQVMGFNWKELGYKSVDDFVDQMKSGEAAHLDSFVRYILVNHLDDELRARDWNTLALRYNGSDYRKNNYHVKLPAAYKKFAKENIDCSTSAAGPETEPAQAVTENVGGDPAVTDPHSTAQPPTSTVSIFERLGKWKEKIDSVSSFKDSINPFTPSLSPISGMSWMGTVTTKLGGWLTFIIGLFTNNPLYILAGVALVAIGIICLVMAKRNAASRGGGGATATAVVEVNQ
jgi:hypothetical protein